MDSINRIQMKLKDVGGARQQVSSLQQQLEEAVSRGEALAADNAALEEELGQWRVHADVSGGRGGEWSSDGCTGM